MEQFICLALPCNEEQSISKQARKGTLFDCAPTHQQVESHLAPQMRNLTLQSDLWFSLEYKPPLYDKIFNRSVIVLPYHIGAMLLAYMRSRSFAIFLT